MTQTTTISRSIFFGHFSIRLGLGVLCCLGVGGCNSPLRKYYSQSTYKEDLREIEKSKVVTGYKAQLIEAYIYDTKQSRLERMRYSEILRLAEEKERRYNSRLLPLRKIVSVEVKKKSFDTLAFGKEFVVLQSRIRNQSNKLITVLRGELRIRSESGKLIKTIAVHFTNNLLSKREVSHTLYALYFEYNLRDNRLRATPLEKLRVSWHPKYIRFENGEELES